jgi:TPP-dependent pyruvate/acetoin dehydrogenase alpha subunit
MKSLSTEGTEKVSFDEFTRVVLEDYKLAHISRNCSSIARKEVLTGKAKFGIFGDGKELAQIAMAKQFRNGDWRSGYYRDQTFLMAAGIVTPQSFFSQIYGDTNPANNPGNAGRNFNNHFATANIDEKGNWLPQAELRNTAADLSPTAAQMPRLVGLAYASKLYRENKDLGSLKEFSNAGNEVAFGMIGDASTSEGHFFETMNAAAVLQIPMAVAVWDDGYGISVTTEFQTVKASISEALQGFERTVEKPGILIYKARGWDYPELCRIFEEGIARCREEHVPVLFHVSEMNQPLGHSTSGSHERYKSRERLNWEKEFDPLKKMREWILESGICTEKTLNELEVQASREAKQAQEAAWE